VRAGRCSRSAALSCAFRHAAFRSVSPVTDCRSGGRDNNNCQPSNISQASRAWRRKSTKVTAAAAAAAAAAATATTAGAAGAGRASALERARARRGERGVDWPIYRTGNKHRAAGVDPSGYRHVYTASVISSSLARSGKVAPARTSNIHFFPGTLPPSPRRRRHKERRADSSLLPGTLTLVVAARRDNEKPPSRRG